MTRGPSCWFVPDTTWEMSDRMYTYDTGSNEELDYSPTTQGSYRCIEFTPVGRTFDFLCPKLSAQQSERTLGEKGDESHTRNQGYKFIAISRFREVRFRCELGRGLIPLALHAWIHSYATDRLPSDRKTTVR